MRDSVHFDDGSLLPLTFPGRVSTEDNEILQYLNLNIARLDHQLEICEWKIDGSLTPFSHERLVLRRSVVYDYGG
jgi:hypothetical protein